MYILLCDKTCVVMYVDTGTDMLYVCIKAVVTLRVRQCMLNHG